MYVRACIEIQGCDLNNAEYGNLPGLLKSAVSEESRLS